MSISTYEVIKQKQLYTMTTGCNITVRDLLAIVAPRYCSSRKDKGPSACSSLGEISKRLQRLFIGCLPIGTCWGFGSKWSKTQQISKLPVPTQYRGQGTLQLKCRRVTRPLYYVILYSERTAWLCDPDIGLTGGQKKSSPSVRVLTSDLLATMVSASPSSLLFWGRANNGHQYSREFAVSLYKFCPVYSTTRLYCASILVTSTLAILHGWFWKGSFLSNLVCVKFLGCTMITVEFTHLCKSFTSCW